MIIWGMIEPHFLHVREISFGVDVSFPEPIVVLHLSDPHFPRQKGKLKRFFKELAQLEPDLIVITGDLTEDEGGVEALVEAVSGLRSRYGIFAVPGNHDYSSYSILESLLFPFGWKGKEVRKNSIERMASALGETSCRLLRNQSVDLQHGKLRIQLIGLDDPVTGRARPEQVPLDLEADLRILLSHSLDILPHYAEGGIHLALSGHTHGGQINLPFYGPPPLPYHSKLGRQYIGGASRFQKTWTHTSRGLGVGRFVYKMRFFCPPEATLIKIFNNQD